MAPSNAPCLFDVAHGVDDGPLVDLADPGDLLVLGVGADGVGALQEADVLVPDGEGGDVHPHLVQREVVRLRKLLSAISCKMYGQLIASGLLSKTY